MKRIHINRKEESYVISEVEVEKETEKQYLLGAGSSRRTLRKADVYSNLSNWKSTFDCYGENESKLIQLAVTFTDEVKETLLKKTLKNNKMGDSLIELKKKTIK